VGGEARATVKQHLPAPRQEWPAPADRSTAALTLLQRSVDAHVRADAPALAQAGTRAGHPRAQSASIIQALLAADPLDELRLNVLPAVVGGGLRLLHKGLPRSAWQLVGALTLETGAVGLHYRRKR
jgi:hypothetical protein